MTPSPHPLPRGDEESDAALSCAVALRDYLQRAKLLLDEQIRDYPKPIPRCDAQFNYLYEQRNRLSAALDEANAAARQALDPARATLVIAGPYTDR